MTFKTEIKPDVRSDFWADCEEGIQCQRCQFFVSKGEGDVGQCRRHAPTLEGWPVMVAEDWCGDFKPDDLTIE